MAMRLSRPAIFSCSLAFILSTSGASPPMRSSRTSTSRAPASCLAVEACAAKGLLGGTGELTRGRTSASVAVPESCAACSAAALANAALLYSCVGSASLFFCLTWCPHVIDYRFPHFRLLQHILLFRLGPRGGSRGFSTSTPKVQRCVNRRDHAER